MPLPLVVADHRRRHGRSVSIRPNALMVRHAHGKVAAAFVVARSAASVVVVLLQSNRPSTLQRVLEVDGWPLREVGLGEDVLVKLLLVRRRDGQMHAAATRIYAGGRLIQSAAATAELAGLP